VIAAFGDTFGLTLPAQLLFDSGFAKIRLGDFREMTLED
tara:strand:- start:436 stop:552 length:117 start_codon:yes stop_codon:yes gene_type:complete